MAAETGIGGSRAGFPETRWTAILAAGDDPAARRRGLDELCRRYWKPLYFFARRRGLAVEPAKDAVQGFLARLVEQDAIGRLDPARGRLRGYLKRGLANHLANEWERERAAKRGGGAAVVSLDVEAAERELSEVATGPEEALDREWALGVMERALERLREELAGRGRADDFELVRLYFKDPEPPPYATAAERFGKSVPQLKSFLHRARARYRELVRAEVAGTVEDPAEADAELDELLRCLRS